MAVECELEDFLLARTERQRKLRMCKLIEQAIHEIRELKKMTSGWESYAWKDNVNVDEIQVFFDDQKTKMIKKEGGK